LPSTFVVTGAAGFIGSHVVEALVARGHDVIGIDNFHPYYEPARKRSNLQEIQATCGSKLTFLEGDIRDADLLDQVFAENEVEGVANLAAMAGVRASIDDPSAYYDVNLVGALRLFDASVGRTKGTASLRRRPNFVLASTSSVYGNTTMIPFTESDPCDRPLAPYSASKRAAEMLAFTYHHLHGLDVTVLRFFTVYGPRNRPDMMAHKVADNIFLGREVPVYSPDKMRRDWTYVSDVAEGVANALERRLGYEICNIGRGEPVGLNDFIHLMERLSGGRASLEPGEAPKSDMEITYADIGKARRLLDYNPQTSVETGVASFLDWYQRAVLGR
jgi:UDP-glucuronate 4-epimerase